MPGVFVKNTRSPDETRQFERGRVEIYNLGEVTVGKGVMEPGWRWSQHVKPIAGTESCQEAHSGICISGRMRVRMDDGQELELGPGDVVEISPGHDAWVVGNEPCVLYDFSGMEHYAKREAVEEAPAVH